MINKKLKNNIKEEERREFGLVPINLLIVEYHKKRKNWSRIRIKLLIFFIFWTNKW